MFAVVSLLSALGDLVGSAFFSAFYPFTLAFHQPRLSYVLLGALSCPPIAILL